MLSARFIRYKEKEMAMNQTELEDYLISIRHHLHQYPEVSNKNLKPQSPLKNG